MAQTRVRCTWRLVLITLLAAQANFVVRGYRPEHPEVLDARPSDFDVHGSRLFEPQKTQPAFGAPATAVALENAASVPASQLQPSVEPHRTLSTAVLPEEPATAKQHILEEKQQILTVGEAAKGKTIESPWKETPSVSSGDTAEESAAEEKQLETWDKVSDLITSANTGKVWIKFRTFTTL